MPRSLPPLSTSARLCRRDWCRRDWCRRDWCRRDWYRHLRTGSRCAQGADTDPRRRPQVLVGAAAAALVLVALVSIPLALSGQSTSSSTASAPNAAAKSIPGPGGTDHRAGASVRRASRRMPPLPFRDWETSALSTSCDRESRALSPSVLPRRARPPESLKLCVGPECKQRHQRNQRHQRRG